MYHGLANRNSQAVSSKNIQTMGSKLLEFFLKKTVRKITGLDVITY